MASTKRIHAWVIVNANGIRVTPDPIRVPYGHKFTIVWEIINSPGCAFDQVNGIDISAGGQKFKKGKKTRTTFSWVDRNTARRPKRRNSNRYAVDVFKYQINVLNGKKQLNLDPAIENENS